VIRPILMKSVDHKSEKANKNAGYKIRFETTEESPLSSYSNLKPSILNHSLDYSTFYELEHKAKVDLKDWAVGLIKASLKLMPDE